MHDWELLALGATVERTYGSSATLVSTTAVGCADAYRVVAAFELRLQERTSLCFAWNEPTAHGHPCLVLQTPAIQTAEEAVCAVVRGRLLSSLEDRAVDNEPEIRKAS